MSLYKEISSFNSLVAGFHQVEESDGACGYDKVNISDFNADSKHELQLVERPKVL